MDAAVSEKFPGIVCTTKWDPFTHRQETKWKDLKTMKAVPKQLDVRIRDFVSGFKVAVKAFSV